MSNATAIKSAVTLSVAAVGGVAGSLSISDVANAQSIEQGNNGAAILQPQNNPVSSDGVCTTASGASDFAPTGQIGTNPPVNVVDPAYSWGGDVDCQFGGDGGDATAHGGDANSESNAQAAAEQYLESHPTATASQVSEHLQSLGFQADLSNSVASSSVSSADNNGNNNGATVNTGNNRTTNTTRIFTPAPLPTSIPGQFGTRFSVQSETSAAQIACDGVVVLSGVNVAAQIGDNAGQIQFQTPVTRGGDQTACSDLPVRSAFDSVINTIAPARPAQAQSQAELQRQGQAVIINIQDDEQPVIRRGRE